MNYIPENIISEIRNAADIVDIVSDMVILKKTGKNYQGLCPFHSEKTPSFSVSPEKQIFYCFGCGAGGNVFSFLMKHEGMSFPEAVRTLARRFGIEVPTRDLTPEEKRRFSEREALLDLNRRAMAYFQHMLWKTRAGEPARAYLERRGIKPAVAETFGLGYAPKGWDHLIRSFSKKKTDPGLLEKAGLTVPRKSGRGFIDRFRDRIMFPIRDIRRQVVGFGGRVMDEGLPKYLNSPETPVFNKSQTLYGVDTARARARETRQMYLVEGYFDVISLYQAGITNAVATLGTALTREHVRSLRGHAGEVTLVFDSDQAGVRAAARSVDIFRKENMDARVLVLPEGHDPDTYILEFGAEAFQSAARKARSVMDFMMEDAVNRHGLSIEGKVRIISELTVPLGAIEDPVARSLYVRRLSERMGVDEAMIMDKVRAAPVGQPENRPRPEIKPASFQGRRMRLEKKLVAMMLQFPEILPEVADREVIDRFEDPSLKSIGQSLVYRYRDYRGGDISDLIDSVDEAHRAVAANLAITGEEWTREGCLNLIAQFETGQKSGSRDLLQRIEVASRDNDQALLMKLLKEKQNQARQRHNKT
ncbi:MAG: DNA primase [Desulfococcaceae bacterium]